MIINSKIILKYLAVEAFVSGIASPQALDESGCGWDLSARGGFVSLTKYLGFFIDQRMRFFNRAWFLSLTKCNWCFLSRGRLACSIQGHIIHVFVLVLRKCL